MMWYCANVPANHCGEILGVKVQHVNEKELPPPFTKLPIRVALTLAPNTGLRWLRDDRAENCSHRYGRVLCVRVATRRSATARQTCCCGVAWESLRGLWCFVSVTTVWRAFCSA